jgi:hypothetical protein
MPNNNNSLPVLTGTPVAGVAMLDRPEKAGYFIFPDLSVRHEGKYRLMFSLYEELKDVKDYDAETVERVSQIHNPQFSHRLEVKSREFVVYSAKKFPGLSNSTDLSRCFAEQGCRVRIRREVRMRRRDTKREEYDDDFEHYERARVSVTPDAYVPQPVSTPIASEPVDRPRSASIASNYGAHTRRPSMEQPHQAYYPSPQPNQQMYSPYAPAPSAYMPPPHQSYPQSTQTTYATAQAPSMPTAYNYHPYQTPYSVAPPQPNCQAPQPPMTSSPYGYDAALLKDERANSVSSQPMPQVQPASLAGQKRSYGSTFDTQAIEAPLHHGARPQVTATDPRYTTPVETAVSTSTMYDDVDLPTMSYRRADGSSRIRNQPLHYASTAL